MKRLCGQQLPPELIKFHMGSTPDNKELIAHIERDEQAGAMIVAPTNRGKSTFIDRGIGNILALHPGVKVSLFDPKGGADFKRCRSFSDFSFFDPVQDTEQSLNRCAALEKLMDDAAEYRKILKTSESIYKLKRRRAPQSENFTINFVIIDEWWRVMHHRKPKNSKDMQPYDNLMEALEKLVQKILREGRSYGFFVLLIGQSPRAEEFDISGSQDSFSFFVFGQALPSLANSPSVGIPELATDPDLEKPGRFYFRSTKIIKFKAPLI